MWSLLAALSHRSHDRRSPHPSDARRGQKQMNRRTARSHHSPHRDPQHWRWPGSRRVVGRPEDRHDGRQQHRAQHAVARRLPDPVARRPEPLSRVEPARGKGGLDIWMASRASTTAPWGAPQNVGEPINSAADDFCPTPVGQERACSS